MMPTLQNSFTWINANSVPKTLSPEFVQNCFTRDNAARSTSISPELMPPKPRQNGCRQISLRWSFSDERLSHWHHIHDSVLTWCRGAGSASWRQGKGPRGFGVADSAIFRLKSKPSTAFFSSKTFCELHFFRMYPICASFGAVWMKQQCMKKTKNNRPDGCHLEIHKPRPLFGQFRLRKVGSAVEVDPMGADRPSLKKTVMPWHPWDWSRWRMTWFITIYYGKSLYVHINLILMICPSHHSDRFVIHWVTRDSKKGDVPNELPAASLFSGGSPAAKGNQGHCLDLRSMKSYQHLPRRAN